MAKKTKSEKKHESSLAGAKEALKKATKKAAAAVKATTKETEPKKQAVTKGKTSVPPKAAPKATKTAPPVKKGPVTKSTAITSGDIGLRAYYIAEQRHRDGIPGNEASDWIEAERQLKAEAAKPKRTASARKA